MLYDDQAATFDARAGFPPQVAARVAAALWEAAGTAAGGLWLDVGAGTGALGLPLLRRGARYVGLDRSAAMLEAFRARAAAGGLPAELVAADGNARWPVDDGAAGVVLSVRALHHLRPEHAAAEVLRVLRPGGALLVGRVGRPDDSVKSLLRREMRSALEAEGWAPRGHGQRVERVLAALEGAGAARLEPREVARWSVAHRPADSVAAWRGKAGLAGADVPGDVKARVLDRVLERAAARYGDPGRAQAQDEWFELSGVRLGGG